MQYTVNNLIARRRRLLNVRNLFADAYLTKKGDKTASQTPIMSNTGKKTLDGGRIMEKYSDA